MNAEEDLDQQVRRPLTTPWLGIVAIVLGIVAFLVLWWFTLAGET